MGTGLHSAWMYVPVYMDVDRRRIVKIYILPTLEVKTSLDYSGTQYSGLVILCEYHQS